LNNRWKLECAEAGNIAMKGRKKEGNKHFRNFFEKEKKERRMNYTAKYVIFFAANISQVQTRIIALQFFVTF
jgi:hypothetical protein